MTEPSALPCVQSAEIVATSHWEDPNEVRVANWLRPWDGVERIDAGILGVPLARGAIKQVGTNYAPNAVRQTGFLFTTYSVDYGIDLRDMVVRDLGDVKIPLIDVLQAHENILEASTAAFAHDPRFIPIFVGGEHSEMRPLIRGLPAGRPDVEKIGIVHFDAHMDVQTLDHAGPHNGTPLRALFDIDDIALDGKNVASIGIGGFANGGEYHRYVQEKGVTVYSSRDVSRRDMVELVGEAYEIAADGTDAVFVTFDIDCMDLAYAPGTGASAPGGLTPWQALDAVFELGRREKVAALEISEIDPTRDIEDMTSRLGMKLILAFLAGVTQR
jgi:formiminoglutamase